MLSLLLTRPILYHRDNNALIVFMLTHLAREKSPRACAYLLCSATDVIYDVHIAKMNHCIAHGECQVTGHRSTDLDRGFWSRGKLCLELLPLTLCTNNTLESPTGHAFGMLVVGQICEGRGKLGSLKLAWFFSANRPSCPHPSWIAVMFSINPCLNA